MSENNPSLNEHDLGWGWSRGNVIACTVLGTAVLGLIVWQWSGRRHFIGAEIAVEPQMVEQVRATLDPNTASAAELMALPGIGPALAERIVNYRQQYQAEQGQAARPFERLEDLQKVKGIGPKTAEEMRPYLEFNSDPESQAEGQLPGESR